ncbi:(2Fe-2S)-binding protein [Bacillus sp. FJAT-27916]|uniref:(2Fe-2S)-binding protein n=1 Tax=Bacillus sp. FJAT-27916 TaxID=1679169 RepID=UPI0006717164|nr:xanthine dehydrogenase subunit XdhC [Bacillus sp. FJAT-27916]
MKAKKADVLPFNQKRKITLSITVNGIRYHLLVNPMEKVMNLLRERLLLFGTLEPCGRGQCQACTVLIEGEMLKSCLLLAHQVNGKSITTIKNVAQRENENKRFMMDERSMLEINPPPSKEQIEQALAVTISQERPEPAQRLAGSSHGTWH